MTNTDNLIARHHELVLHLTVQFRRNSWAMKHEKIAQKERDTWEKLIAKDNRKK